MTPKLAYQNPQITAENDLLKNASHFVQSLQTLQAWYGQAWKENPIVLNIMTLGDIFHVGLYVDYFWNETHGVLDEGDPKILLYVTPKKWNDLCNGPDAEFVASNVQKKAQPMISEYSVAKPTIPIYVPKVYYWEYKAGMVEYQPSGVFNHEVEPGTPTTPSQPTTVQVDNVRLECLRLAVESNPFIPHKTIDDILSSANKFLEWMDKE